MRISDLLKAYANDLEDVENPALLLSEYDEKCLEVVAHALVQAADLLKNAASEVDAIEPEAESVITPESIEEIANLATALDSSDDPALRKQASVLDELLLTIAAPKDAIRNKKAEEDARLETLRLKYQGTAEKLKDYNKTADQAKEVEKSEYVKNMPIEGSPLKARSCPDHPGTGMFKLEGSDSVYICSLDHKHYDFENGFTLLNGTKVPGGSVSAQSDLGLDNRFFATFFDSRDGRLNNK
jgi:hypothetical protein